MALFWSGDPPSEGFALNLGNADPRLAPPDYHTITPEEYLGYLRARWREDPRPFVELAWRAATEDLTLCSGDRPDLVPVLWRAIVGVAAMRGIGRGVQGVAGGQRPARPKDLSGRYVPGR